MKALAAAKLTDASTAARLIKRGDTVILGGFGIVKPMTVVNALLTNPDATDLTVIQQPWRPGKGLGALLAAGRIQTAIGSFFTSNPDAVTAHHEGRLRVQLTPQGTLAEAIRAGGAGVAAFYVRTGAGSEIAEGRESRFFDGHEYVLWQALRANVALIKARRSDTRGNLVYEKTARNFSTPTWRLQHTSS